MRNTKKMTSLVMLLVALLFTATAWAQDAKPKASPPASASGKVGSAAVTVNYSSPSVKGRTIWGELVPYGKVWRAGANEATTVTFDKDVMVEGKALPAGTYSFYAIPDKDKWTVIFNKVAKQWGTQYDESKDALRVDVRPRKSATMNERLKYDVTKNGLLLSWENLEVPVMVKAK